MSKYGAHESAAYSKIDTDRDPENETRSYFILKFLNDALDTYGCIFHVLLWQHSGYGFARSVQNGSRLHWVGRMGECTARPSALLYMPLDSGVTSMAVVPSPWTPLTPNEATFTPRTDTSVALYCTVPFPYCETWPLSLSLFCHPLRAHVSFHGGLFVAQRCCPNGQWCTPFFNV